jgi:peptidoglycan/xylan/chitin deacetylase (PgdA/CDA1 family)
MRLKPSFGGKREMLARGLYWSGASSLLSLLPARDSLMVLNYHRIGNAEEDRFDPGVFSATAAEFDDQIGYLKKRFSMVTLDEALAYAEGSSKNTSKGCRALITFDDGYLDNYQIAYPILRSHGVQGVFFLATGMVGSAHLPWWDHIAYLVRTARRRTFQLSYPGAAEIDLDRDGLAVSLRTVLQLYKRPENADAERFLRELAEAADGEQVPGTERRFLNWDEAREMRLGGMAIGSHTHSHCVLSQLDPERQAEELSTSRAILTEELGVQPEAIAYPVGQTSSFTLETQKIAREVGYRGAFSFYGGANLQGQMSQFDLKRTGIDNCSGVRFRVQTTFCRFRGSCWP